MGLLGFGKFILLCVVNGFNLVIWGEVQVYDGIKYVNLEICVEVELCVL